MRDTPDALRGVNVPLTCGGWYGCLIGSAPRLPSPPRLAREIRLPAPRVTRFGQAQRVDRIPPGIAPHALISAPDQIRRVDAQSGQAKDSRRIPDQRTACIPVAVMLEPGAPNRTARSSATKCEQPWRLPQPFGWKQTKPHDRQLRPRAARPLPNWPPAGGHSGECDEPGSTRTSEREVRAIHKPVQGLGFGSAPCCYDFPASPANHRSNSTTHTN